MDAHVLLDGYERIVYTIYNPYEYFQRALNSLSRLGTSARTHLAWTDAMVLGRSIWHQGLRSNYRRAYWKFLVQSLRCHRPHFRQAVALAIMGHDFLEQYLV
jgi:hypothetical protein